MIEVQGEFDEEDRVDQPEEVQNAKVFEDAFKPGTIINFDESLLSRILTLDI